MKSFHLVRRSCLVGRFKSQVIMKNII